MRTWMAVAHVLGKPQTRGFARRVAGTRKAMDQEVPLTRSEGPKAELLRQDFQQRRSSEDQERSSWKD